MLGRILKILFSPVQLHEAPRDSGDRDDPVLVRTLDHAKVGYQNAQDVIKFVDTKTAVVTGLSTVLGGFLLVVLKWSVELDGVSRPNLKQLTAASPCIAIWFYLLVLISLGSAIACLTAAVWSVIARARPNHLENKFTILFPLYRERDATAACRAFEQKLKGMTVGEIINEYEDQLRIIGMILGKKLKHIRVSCVFLVIQIVCLTVALGLFAWMYATHPAMPGPKHPVSATFILGNNGAEG
jgi:hypothetical protein